MDLKLVALTPDYRKVLLLLILIVVGQSVIYAQSLNKLLQNASNPPVTITHNDSIQLVSLLGQGIKVKPNINLFYFWYTGNMIKSTRGDFAGKLLNGDYKVFSEKKDLLVKGQFKRGLKAHTWIQWYPDGKIKQVENWRNGIKSGSFKIYEPDGALKSKGNYRKGQLHGEAYTYSNGKEQVIYYENGQIIQKGAKPVNKFKFWKHIKGGQDKNAKPKLEEKGEPAEKKKPLRKQNTAKKKAEPAIEKKRKRENQ